jgi:hypothetical protein
VHHHIRVLESRVRDVGIEQVADDGAGIINDVGWLVQVDQPEPVSLPEQRPELRGDLPRSSGQDEQWTGHSATASNRTAFARW